jgi:maleylpyruvate isomerase
MIGSSNVSSPRAYAMAPDGPTIAAAVADRTDEIIEALADLDQAGWHAPSRLEGWSRLTVACHLRYGAEALYRMTTETIAGRPSSFYPQGRAAQRPGTLVPRRGEDSSAVVRSLAATAEKLNRLWGRLDDEWNLVVIQPKATRDLSSLPLVAQALLRLTEVEVHGEDLRLGLTDWSTVFVTAALPFRLERLNLSYRLHQSSPQPRTSWIVAATDGPAYRVSLRGTTVESRPAAEGDTAEATIEGSSRDLLALLVGRTPRQPLSMAGNRAMATEFSQAFPGP